MKKTYRIISAVVLACFLLNTVSYGIDVNSPISGRSAYHKLATPSSCDDLLGIEHKDIGRIKFALMSHLRTLPDYLRAEYLKPPLAGSPALQLKEKTIFSPVNIQFFLNERTNLPNGYTLIKCRITDRKPKSRESKKRTYYIVLTAQEDNTEEVKIKEIYTEKEYQTFKKLLEKAEKVPRRKSKDAKAIRRYIQHEKKIDSWIEKQMKNKDNYIEIEPGYAKRLLDPVFEGADQINNLDTALRGRLGDIIAEILTKRKLILIKVGKDNNVPVIRENGKNIEVGSHTSENAMYIFMDDKESLLPRVYGEPKIISSRFEIFRRYLESDTIGDMGMGELNRLAALLEVRLITRLYVIPKLIHEIGVICGLDYEVTEDGRIINDMDRLHEAAEDKGIKEIIRIPLVKELDEKLSLVNLNHLRGEDKPYERDYAYGLTDDDEKLMRQDIRDKKLMWKINEKLRDKLEALRKSTVGNVGEFFNKELRDEIEAIWKSAGEKIDEPFSSEAQQAFAEIIDLYKSKVKSPITGSLATSYKNFYALLFKKGDYKNAIRFFKIIKEWEDKEGGLSIALSNMSDADKAKFFEFYLITKMLDRESTISAASAKESSAIFFMKELLGNDFDIETVFGTSPADTVDFGHRITRNLFGFIRAYKDAGKHSEALKLIASCVRCFTNELKLDSSETFMQEITKTLGEFAKLRDEIKAEMDAVGGSSSAARQGKDGISDDIPSGPRKPITSEWLVLVQELGFRARVDQGLQ